ncbi:hypothetical protein PsAD2_00957 [Pseudovibrio axinellae]|uniref:Uncharacterized protein n=1 Tax=Pseudovibrio axinellae TaxID=989403 RepID=A0A166AEH2_9HYPH|nr:hypothetical protein PsAD2_00957 [Pseudovibrio axinellae]SEP81043.1 hypothetical protein SAMN05421798_101444 [Pseudovibrio axinellae]
MGTLHDLVTERSRRQPVQLRRAYSKRASSAQIHLFPGVHKMPTDAACCNRIGIIRVVEDHSEYERD